MCYVWTRGYMTDKKFWVNDETEKWIYQNCSSYVNYLQGTLSSQFVGNIVFQTFLIYLVILIVTFRQFAFKIKKMN